MGIFKKKRLGEILLEGGFITKEQINAALSEQKKSRQPLSKILIDNGYISEEKLIEALERHLGISYVNLNNIKVDPEVGTSIPLYLAQRYQVIPIHKEADCLTLAMADPLNIIAIDSVVRETGHEVKPVIADEMAVNRLIEQFFGLKEYMEALKSIHLYSISKDEDKETLKVQELVNEAPIVKVVNSIIQQAVSEGASDIHLEPYQQGLLIRLRIDGILHDLMSAPKNIQPLIISRIKIMSNMDISEKRLPQDGRITYQAEGRPINMRVSTLPTIFGEKIVLRILDKDKIILPLDELGFSQPNFSLFNKFIKASSGIILVTGPAGCGKTTTLYSTLNHLKSKEKNIITVEDPVEYHLQGVNQVQVNAGIGLNFAKALRTILRQDPNIIMIGEIRDFETAEIAARSALTGHLVFSTIHTNDAPRTIIRLVDMGVKNYLLASSIIGVVAQRLVRKICLFCKQEYKPSTEEEKAFNYYYKRVNKPVFLRGKGCPRCNNTGFKGRSAVHEVMPFSDNLKNIILAGPSLEEIYTQARKDGIITLQEDGMRLAAEGITTIDEVLRVTFTGL